MKVGLVALVGLLLACVLAPGAASARQADEQVARAQQACADRWSLMNFTYQEPGSEVIITGTSPCALNVNYGDNGNGGFNVLPCEVNKFGAWACASHAQMILEAPVAWNAHIENRGKLALDAPPANPPAVKRPSWVKRYAVRNGYIVPFDRKGRLRSGLKLHGSSSRGIQGCGVGTVHETTELSCVTGYTCFSKHRRLRAGDPIACPDAPGSTRFTRGYAAEYE